MRSRIAYGLALFGCAAWLSGYCSAAAPAADATDRAARRAETSGSCSTPGRESGFFPAKGSGATVSCNTPVGGLGPTHFEPASLFRDTLTDHGRFTSTTALIVVSSKLLPRGSLTVRFPDEVGERTSPFADNLRWSNLGRLVLRAS